ncbi:hypothetical protein NHQ30_007798 [Ciborinia camelliae]|nr:hypothetical protein NHQ30_007798 [Ciborinia camelliae]
MSYIYIQYPPFGKLIAYFLSSLPYHTVGGITSSSNAVLPAWRTALIHAIVQATWDLQTSQAVNMLEVSALTDSIVPQLEVLTTGNGSYLNEADHRLRTWKEDFYGVNYQRLRKVKEIYDPADIFYAAAAVGSDAWSVASDGRLCRAG